MATALLSSFWTAHEDDILWKAAKAQGCGEVQWGAVIEQLNSKTPEQCDQRWKFLQMIYVGEGADDQELGSVLPLETAPREEEDKEGVAVNEKQSEPTTPGGNKEEGQEEKLDKDDALSKIQECQRQLKRMDVADMDIVRSTSPPDEKVQEQPLDNQKKLNEKNGDGIKNKRKRRGSKGNSRGSKRFAPATSVGVAPPPPEMKEEELARVPESESEMKTEDHPDNSEPHVATSDGLE